MLVVIDRIKLIESRDYTNCLCGGEFVFVPVVDDGLKRKAYAELETRFRILIIVGNPQLNRAKKRIVF